MYLVQGAHEAIIDRETFERVQEELKRRAEERTPAPQARDAYPFTGIITCGHCGKHYRRKTVVSPGYAPKVVWICATYNTLGKKACPSKQIPETILMEAAASVLEIPTFNEEAFTARVSAIRIPAANQLVFVMKDGQEIKRDWKDHSRRDSWDEAGRQCAREYAKRRYAKMSEAARNITVFPATIQRYSAHNASLTEKKRVAGYARVSTDDEEQQTSYEAQVDYYTQYIQSKAEWTFVEVYTDDGVSATNTKKREGFNRMIREALAGRIDLIVTKSVSRFARNTVDTLMTIRKLKEKGVGVVFEKENIDTLDSKGELLITIMSSLAQEESRSISENVTWGQRKRFSDGKVTMPFKHFLGYARNSNGTPRLVESEARIVRQVYAMCMDGQTPSGIAAALTKQGVPSPSGLTQWSPSTVKSILTNEKYKGDALLQKSFTVDFLNKKMKPNEGEVPSYYVKNSHPAIVSEELFDMVQHELLRRKESGRKHRGDTCFSGKIICGDCGGVYGSKVWHSTSKYRRVVWQCNCKFKNASPCATPHLSNIEIQQAFVAAINGVLRKKAEILITCRDLIRFVSDVSTLENQRNENKANAEDVLAVMRNAVHENARTAQDQEEYDEHYAELTDAYQQAAARLKELESQILERKARSDRLNAYIDVIEAAKPITNFDEGLWNATLETLTVKNDGTLLFHWKDGSESVC